MFDSATITMLGKGIIETIYMTLVSSFLAYIIGLPLGILLVVTDKNGISPFSPINSILGTIINLLRSVPFIILLIAIIPFTRFIVGKAIGSTAVIVPLVLSSAPYIARLVESSLKEVDKGVIEAVQSMGASNFQIIFHVMLPEAKPSLINGATIAVTTILGYSSMSGFVGGGGLGDIAIRYGYNRYEFDIMIITIILLVIIVQALQGIGNQIMKHTDKRI